MTMNLSRMLSIGTITTVLAALASVSGAHAQFYPPFGHGPFGPGFGGPYVRGYASGIYIERTVPPSRFLHPAQVTRMLESLGYRSVDVLQRRGDMFVVNALSPRREAMRLIVDAHDGEIVERFTTGPVAARQNDQPRSSSPKSEPKRGTAQTPPIAMLPTPPRRPQNAIVDVPKVAAPPAAARRASDWAPINSVPPAPLD